MKPEWRVGADYAVSDWEWKTSKQLWQSKTRAETVLQPEIICLEEKGLRADGSVIVRRVCGIRESCDATSYRRMAGGCAVLL